jgi:acetylornithine deacetylase/succinyl-diaminopimelate desuccinylase-like protein
MDHAAAARTAHELWETTIAESLSGLVRIPAVSAAFDPDWDETGYIDAAIRHVAEWIAGRGIVGAELEVVRLPGRCPVLLVDIPAAGYSGTDTVLAYGHLDKQPPVAGWSEGLDAWTPVRRGERLYGRGAADDGYAGYAATAAIEALRAAGGAHARCVLLAETGEESGSPDLPAYLEHLRPRLGDVSLVVCLDSGTQDYQRMWLTTSLRGLAQATVTVRVLEGGQHSGQASGLVADSFRVLRSLADRLEDAATGEVALPEMHAPVPAERLAEVREAVATAPGQVAGALPLVPGTRTVSDDEVELTLNGTWRPTLTVIGADGLPAPEQAGNVLRSHTTLCLSFRLPPTADSARALAALRSALATDVPYGASVELTGMEAADGWNAPPLAPWLSGALDEVSQRVFGAPWRSLGLGGSIPFMGLLARAYPEAQFVVTGVLGPGSNAHVPDESLHLPYAARLTEAIAYLLDAHAGR